MENKLNCGEANTNLTICCIHFPTSLCLPRSTRLGLQEFSENIEMPAKSRKSQQVVHSPSLLLPTLTAKRKRTKSSVEVYPLVHTISYDMMQMVESYQLLMKYNRINDSGNRIGRHVQKTGTSSSQQMMVHVKY